MMICGNRPWGLSVFFAGSTASLDSNFTRVRGVAKGRLILECNGKLMCLYRNGIKVWTCRWFPVLLQTGFFDEGLEGARFSCEAVSEPFLSNSRPLATWSMSVSGIAYGRLFQNVLDCIRELLRLKVASVEGQLKTVFQIQSISLRFISAVDRVVFIGRGTSVKASF